MQNFKHLAIFCGCTDWFLSDLVRNPKDRFCCDPAYLIFYSAEHRTKDSHDCSQVHIHTHINFHKFLDTVKICENHSYENSNRNFAVYHREMLHKDTELIANSEDSPRSCLI